MDLPGKGFLVRRKTTLFHFSCNKEEDTPPQETDNEVKATVLVEGATPFMFLAKGNATTIFGASYVANGDTVIGFGGSYNDAQLAITLVNISKPGNYPPTREINI